MDPYAKFQTLIGSARTAWVVAGRRSPGEFQTLIGSARTVKHPKGDFTDYMFQTLIGSARTHTSSGF